MTAPFNPLQDRLNALAILSATIDSHEQSIKPLKDREKQLRSEILVDLQAAGLPTFRSDLATASIVRKTEVTVDDEMAVVDWLIEQGPEFAQSHFILDIPAVKKLPERFGSVPGLSISNPEHLRISLTLPGSGS